MSTDLLNKVLRLGEGRQIKQMQSRVVAIGAREAELERLSDDELLQRSQGLREQVANGADLGRHPRRRVRAGARGGPAHVGHAALRRAADRCPGTPRRAHRRDEDRRGQDVLRDRGGLSERARRGRGARGHRQRLPGPPRRRVDASGLQRARHDRRGHRNHARPGHAPRGLRGRRHLRHQLRVRLRLPARQHGRAARRHGPARLQLLHRGRGRLDPDRRGAHAADHLGHPGGRGRHLLPLRPHHPDLAQAHRLRDRREGALGGADREWGREDRARAGHREPLPGHQRAAGQPPHPGPQGPRALSPRQGVHRPRRRGADRRRVHRAGARGPPVLGGTAPGDRGQGGLADPRGEPDPRHDHPAELLPHVRQAVGDDRHGRDRGQRVQQDLQRRRRVDSDQQAGHPRRRAGLHLQDQGREVHRRGRRHRRGP